MTKKWTEPQRDVGPNIPTYAKENSRRGEGERSKKNIWRNNGKKLTKDGKTKYATVTIPEEELD